MQLLMLSPLWFGQKVYLACSETVTDMQCSQDMIEQCNEYLESLGNEEIYSYA